MRDMRAPDEAGLVPQTYGLEVSRLKAGLLAGAAIVAAGLAVRQFEPGDHNPITTPSTLVEPNHQSPEAGTIPATRIDQVFRLAADKLDETSHRLPIGKYPYYTGHDNGEWTHRGGPDVWVAGYFPGMLWLMYAKTHDAKWKQAAEKWSEPIHARNVLPDNREIGLVMLPDYGNGFELTDDPQYRAALLTAAKGLAERYDPKVKAFGGVVKGSQGERFRMIIDNTMSLQLLFWAAQNGEPAARQIAINHALTARHNLVRPDGSVYQDGVFSTHDGTLLKRFSLQGYSDTSVWSRGQSWAIGGFTDAYKATGDPRFLDTAEQTADYFINNLPPDSVPYWDFKAPDIPNAPRDTAAAAIASSSLIELSSLEPDPAKQQKYFTAAQNILSSLLSTKYLSTKGEALLKHATQFGKLARTSDTGLVYADYYLMQALLRYQYSTGQSTASGSSAVSFGLVK